MGDPIYHINLIELGGLVIFVAVCVIASAVAAVAAACSALVKAWRGRWRSAVALMPGGYEETIRVRRVPGSRGTGWRGTWLSQPPDVFPRAQTVTLSDGTVAKRAGWVKP